VIQVDRCAQIYGHCVIYRAKFKTLRVPVFLISEVAFEAILLINTMFLVRCARQSIVVSDLLYREVEGIRVEGYLFFYKLTGLYDLQVLRVLNCCIGLDFFLIISLDIFCLTNLVNLLVALSLC